MLHIQIFNTHLLNTICRQHTVIAGNTGKTQVKSSKYQAFFKKSELKSYSDYYLNFFIEHGVWLVLSWCLVEFFSTKGTLPMASLEDFQARPTAILLCPSIQCCINFSPDLIFINKILGSRPWIFQSLKNPGSKH